MNPYLHEFESLLRRPAIVAVAILAIGTAALGYVAVDSTQVLVSGAGFWYYADGAYHFDFWFVDDAGEPVRGVQLGLLIAPTNDSYQPVSTLFSGTGTSGNNGSIQFLAPLTSGSYSVDPTAKYPAVPGAVFEFPGGSFTLTNGSPELPVSVGFPLSLVAQSFYSTQARVLLLWEGPDGTSPAGDRVVYCSVLVQQPEFPFPQNCTGSPLHPLGVIGGYTTFLPRPPAPPPLSVQFIEVLSPSGALLYTTSVACSACVGLPSDSSFSIPIPGPTLLGSSATELGFFVPFMGFLLAYWSYVRPRLTGTVEPVLARPITRRGLFLVRYWGTALVLVVAAAAEVLALDLGASVLLREPLPASDLGALIGVVAVAGVAFAGLLFASAHALRSAGVALSAGIVMLILLTFFWSTLVQLVAFAAGVPVSGASSLNIVLYSQLFSPPQLPSLVVAFLSGYSTTGAVFATSGLQLSEFFLASALWLAVPFAVIFWRVVKYD